MKVPLDAVDREMPRLGVMGGGVPCAAETRSDGGSVSDMHLPTSAGHPHHLANTLTTAVKKPNNYDENLGYVTPAPARSQPQ